MTTTFTTRKTIRDRLKALFDADGSWDTVYSGMPPIDDIAGQSVICTIVSDGTQTTFESLNHNRRNHQFIVTNWVLYQVTSDSWTYDKAEDKIDELELKTAQLIRNNAAGSTVADLLQFSPAYSQVRRITVNQNYSYAVESYTVIATLATGAL